MCADVVERFQLLLFLSLIVLQDSGSWEGLLAMLPPAVSCRIMCTSCLLTDLMYCPVCYQMGVYFCEVGMDWVKHAFVVKFNRIHSDLYKKFTSLLCHDYVLARRQLTVSYLLVG